MFVIYVLERCKDNCPLLVEITTINIMFMIWLNNDIKTIELFKNRCYAKNDLNIKNDVCNQ